MTVPSPEWRATTSTPRGMTEEEVEALLEAMKGVVSGRKGEKEDFL